MIAKSTDGGVKFGAPVEIPITIPFNQGSRPADIDNPGTPEREEDSFRMFRTNAYPALAVDDYGRVYLAWSERGYWGGDNPADGVLDGSRIVLTYSTDEGASWSLPTPADLSDLGPDKGGHHIMPSLSYAAGKLTLLYYDFRYQ